MAKVTIFGAGAMGSALTVPLAENDNEVRLLGTHLDDLIIDELKKGNVHPKHKEYLPNSVKYFHFSELKEALKDIDLLIMGVTSDGLGPMFEKAIPFLKDGMIVGSVSKGYVYSRIDSKKIIILPELLNELLPKELNNIDFVFIGGPCKALEVVTKCPNSVTFASKNIEAAKKMASMLRTKEYNVEVSTDVIGTEICAAMKNAYSIGLGMAEGFKDIDGKLNNNCKAALFTFAVAEMGLLVEAMGGTYASVIGLPGVGDLEITGEAGRNRILGEVVGAGMTSSKAIKKMKDEDITVEGYPAIKYGYNLSKALINEGRLEEGSLPLLDALYDILYQDAPSYKTIKETMTKCTGKY